MPAAVSQTRRAEFCFSRMWQNCSYVAKLWSTKEKLKTVYGNVWGDTKSYGAFAPIAILYYTRRLSQTNANSPVSLKCDYISSVPQRGIFGSYIILSSHKVLPPPSHCISLRQDNDELVYFSFGVITRRVNLELSLPWRRIYSYR